MQQVVSVSELVQAQRAIRTIYVDDLVKGWAAEKKPAAKTLYAWKAVIEKLKKSIGHDNAARLTPEWKTDTIL